MVTGTFVGKPATLTRAMSSPMSCSNGNQNLSSIAIPGTLPAVPNSQQGSVIVVDLSQDVTSTTNTASNASNTALADLLQATGILAGSSSSNQQKEGSSSTAEGVKPSSSQIVSSTTNPDQNQFIPRSSQSIGQ